MITFVHGDDTAKSLAHYYLLTQKLVNLQEVNGKSASASEIELIFDSGSLFESGSVQKQVSVLEFGKLSKDALLMLINKSNSSNTSVYIWEGRKIDKRHIAKFKDAQNLEFSLPKYYFQFLDSILPKNAKMCVTALNHLSEQLSDEQVFYSLIKRIRTLMMLKNGSHKFEETSKMNDWQRQKLEVQARAWNEESLVRIYKKLFDLEVGMKTSALSTKLIKHIDILLLNELK